MDDAVKTLAPLLNPPAPVEGVDDVLALFEAAGSPQYNPAPWAVTALKEAAGAQGWDRVRVAATAYLDQPGSKRSLKDFAPSVGRLMATRCDHPKALRVPWTAPVDPRRPEGLQARQWRCGVKGCGHHAYYDVPHFLKSGHVHDYVDQVGKAWLLTETGVNEVAKWSECAKCGHQVERVGVPS